MSAARYSMMKRLAWAALVFVLGFCLAVWFVRSLSAHDQSLSDGQLMTTLFAFPAAAAACVFAFLSFGFGSASAAQSTVAPDATSTPKAEAPFVAQVVGLQWLNPLQRKDYPAEWQLLWTLGLVKPNKNDYYVKTQPEKFTKLGVIVPIAANIGGTETLKGYFHKYHEELAALFHDIYFTNDTYFYTIGPDDKRKWRELAGIRVELAVPPRLDREETQTFVREEIAEMFNFGNPRLGTKSTPPDVQVTLGGANAGFTSLSRALDYLKQHPQESVWVMNWDAPDFPSRDARLNENLVLLVLTGPEFKTEREPLAWIGYPATSQVADFKAEKGMPSRLVQAWKAAIETAAKNAGKADTDIGYVVHDAHHVSERIGPLAETLTTELPEFDVLKQGFNTPRVLGDMGAGTALTNVALAIAYANHLGKTVLVAGTTEGEQPTAVVVAPPAQVRPIDAEQDWYRARGGDKAYLPWWGLRHDAPKYRQGYSE